MVEHYDGNVKGNITWSAKSRVIHKKCLETLVVTEFYHFREPSLRKLPLGKKSAIITLPEKNSAFLEAFGVVLRLN